MKRLLLVLCFALWPAISWAQDSDLIRSDLPLWTNDAEHMWPRHTYDAQSFGCVHPIQLGDWVFHPAPEARGIDTWYRLSNYGVVHCFIIEHRAFEAEQLGRGEWRYSMLVELGSGVGPDGKPLELWTLQSGVRPGTEYLLLARRPAKEIVREFDVLQRQCPKGSIRKSENIDILLTEYCAINSQVDLRALAGQMARRPPLGKLRFDKAAPKGKE